MSTISKVFTVVNIVLAMFLLGSVAAILSESTDYKVKWEDEVRDRAGDLDRLNSEVAAAKARADAKEAEALAWENQKNTTETENIALKTENDSLKRDLNGQREELSQLNQSLTDLTAQLKTTSDRRDELVAQVDDLRGERDSATDSKRDAEDDRARLEKDIERLEGDIGDLETRLVEVTERRDVLLAEQAALTSLGVNIPMLIGNNVPPIDAVVSDVGSNFVVLSVGETEGVKIGFPFDVYRNGGVYIGRVVVDKVYPDNCIARVMMKSPDQTFMANDSASTRL